MHFSMSILSYIYYYDSFFRLIQPLVQFFLRFFSNWLSLFHTRSYLSFKYFPSYQILVIFPPSTLPYPSLSLSVPPLYPYHLFILLPLIFSSFPWLPSSYPSLISSLHLRTFSLPTNRTISSPSRVLVSLIFPPSLDHCSLYFPSLLSISSISSLRLSSNSHLSSFPLPIRFPLTFPYLLQQLLRTCPSHPY